MTEEGQKAPKFANLFESVRALAEQKYLDLICSKTTVQEFWADEGRGGLSRILVYFSGNPDVTKISDNDKEKINTIISTVSSKLSEWETSKVGNPNQHSALDREIRKTYTEAVEILKQYLSQQATQEQAVGLKLATQEPGTRLAVPRQEQILKLIIEFFMVMEWIPKMTLTAARTVLELSIPNNMSNVVTWAQLGTGHCDSLRRDYEALSKTIESVLPKVDWDQDRLGKAEEAFQTTNKQIGEVERCFNDIPSKKDKIKDEICNLRNRYQEYCVITISEILSRKGGQA